MSDYEEVNSSNCVTMIAVMPAGSGNGNTTTLASQPENLGKSTPDSTSLLASRSETSSSEGECMCHSGAGQKNCRQKTREIK